MTSIAAHESAECAVQTRLREELSSAVATAQITEHRASAYAAGVESSAAHAQDGLL